MTPTKTGNKTNARGIVGTSYTNEKRSIDSGHSSNVSQIYEGRGRSSRVHSVNGGSMVQSRLSNHQQLHCYKSVVYTFRTLQPTFLLTSRGDEGHTCGKGYTGTSDRTVPHTSPYLRQRVRTVDLIETGNEIRHLTPSLLPFDRDSIRNPPSPVKINGNFRG